MVSQRETLCDKETVGKLTDFSERSPSSLSLSVHFSLSVPLFLHWDVIFIVYAWILPVENNLQRERERDSKKQVNKLQHMVTSHSMTAFQLESAVFH